MVWTSDEPLAGNQPATVEEAQTIRIRINEQIGEVAQHMSAVEFERLHRDITALIAAVRAEPLRSGEPT